MNFTRFLRADLTFLAKCLLPELYNLLELGYSPSYGREAWNRIINFSLSGRPQKKPESRRSMQTRYVYCMYYSET